MNILDTEAGKQLVAKVGVKKAKKLIRQEMTSKMVSHIERQGLSTGTAQRTRQTRELLKRPTVGIDNSLRYADLSKKNPRLMGESIGAPMKQKRALRILKSMKNLPGDLYDKAFRSLKIRRGKGDPIRIPTPPGGGAKDPRKIRTYFGVDRPSTSQGGEGIMGAVRANIRAEMKRRADKINPLDSLKSTLNKTITIRGEREQRLAAKHGSKERRRGKSNQ